MENKYDLILMDIQMPIMNGVEAAKLIRENKNNHHPYIVAITADALKGGKQTYLSAGMNDFLFKPVSLEGIEKVIQKYISSIRH
jgi:CheY-like chemotaxis protein